MLAGGLAALELPRGAALLVLARNGIDHALLAFAAMSLEMPVAAISPQYGLQGAAPERLAHAVKVISPGAVYVDDGIAFVEARASPQLVGLPVIAGRNPAKGDVDFGWLGAQGRSTARPNPDALAKLLLTSGSTGAPKAVMCLHRAVAVNAAQVTACYDDADPPVVVNQAPWSHSLGANAILQDGSASRRHALHRPRRARGGALGRDSPQPAGDRAHLSQHGSRRMGPAGRRSGAG